MTLTQRSQSPAAGATTFESDSSFYSRLIKIASSQSEPLINWLMEPSEITRLPENPYSIHFGIPVDTGTAEDLILPRDLRETRKIAWADHIYNLFNAYSDLKKVQAEAREEGYPVPLDAALHSAVRLLPAMHKILPQRFEVYPTPDREVAIHASGGLGRSVILLCDSDGGALCLVNINNKHRRAHYSDTSALPDGFIREALSELKIQAYSDT